jgi:FtsP/CotA-like multicopper oxidase with cupredoxin domain
MSLSRRNLLKAGALGGAAVALPLERIAHTKGGVDRMRTSRMPKPFSLPFTVPPVAVPTHNEDVKCLDGVGRSYPCYDLTQMFSVAEIMPGYKTPFFGYNGILAGPTIVAHHGQPIVVNQTNALHLPPPAPNQNAKVPSPYTNNPFQRWTSTHLHGSASLPQYDGYASDITMPGQRKRYFYPNCQEARTIWYHDHGVHHTAQNAYNGLAAMYILHDPEELALGIPQGRYDVPIVLRDAMFDSKGGLVYEDNSESGVYGDVILINGVPWPEMRVERRKYRFRFLNASVSRSYRWLLHDGRDPVPMTMIATDAGLMPRPQQITSFKIGMAERYEVVIDFAEYSDNTLLTFRNLSPDNNIDYDTTEYGMRFRVVGDATSTENNDIPEDWEVRRPAPECMTWNEADLLAQKVPDRRFEFIRTNGHWTINGETWEDVINSGYTHCAAEPAHDSIEIWELANKSGGWFHPVHIHLVDFQVLSRNGSASRVFDYEKGPKDVVYVGENETVRVAMRFAGPAAGEGWPTPKGRYMMHCHNLVHEDHDMMVQFSVGDPEHDPLVDPIAGEKPVWL